MVHDTISIRFIPLKIITTEKYRFVNGDIVFLLCSLLRNGADFAECNTEGLVVVPHQLAIAKCACLCSEEKLLQYAPE